MGLLQSLGNDRLGGVRGTGHGDLAVIRVREGESAVRHRSELRLARLAKLLAEVSFQSAMLSRRTALDHFQERVQGAGIQVRIASDNGDSIRDMPVIILVVLVASADVERVATQARKESRRSRSCGNGESCFMVAFKPG